MHFSEYLGLQKLIVIRGYSQIEEMAKISCNATNPELGRECTKCPFDMMCDIQNSCIALYDAGYRKQSEGEWEEQLEEYGETYCFVGFQCSKCEKEFSVPYEVDRDDWLQMMKFCPNCGAKMKGGEE